MLTSSTSTAAALTCPTSPPKYLILFPSPETVISASETRSAFAAEAPSSRPISPPPALIVVSDTQMLPTMRTGASAVPATANPSPAPSVKRPNKAPASPLLWFACSAMPSGNTNPVPSNAPYPSAVFRAYRPNMPPVYQLLTSPLPTRLFAFTPMLAGSVNAFPSPNANAAFAASPAMPPV